MPRLIDADALLERMKRTSRYFNIKFDIEEVPTIEAEPVRHGRWVFEEDEVHPWLTKAICSNCEKVAEKSSHLQFRIGKKTFLHDHTYCPNCGAKMDGDSHDQEG